MKIRFENIEQRLRDMEGALRLRGAQGLGRVVSTDWPPEDPRMDVLRLRRARAG